MFEYILLMILVVIPMTLTAVYFLCSTRVYQNLKRIKKENGRFITIVFMILCIGCWPLFWFVHISPSIADNMKRY
jgi:hypothetical protein